MTMNTKANTINFAYDKQMTNRNNPMHAQNKLLWRRRKSYPLVKQPWTPPPCRHGTDCVKFGCVFSHPPSRPKDCDLGAKCVIVGCKLLHPRSEVSLTRCWTCPEAMGENTTPADKTLYDRRLNLKPGTIVLCKRHPSDPVWISAKLIRIVGHTITVKVEGCDKDEDMPLNSVRCPPPKTPCRHGISCVKFGCMFTHPEWRRKDCPKGGECQDSDCKHLHPSSRSVHLSCPTMTSPSVTLTTKHITLPTKSTCFGCHTIPTEQAEAALELLMRVVDSNEDFLLVRRNLQLLQILGLKAKKKQAVIDEEFLIAHNIKNEIDNLSQKYLNTK